MVTYIFPFFSLQPFTKEDSEWQGLPGPGHNNSEQVACQPKHNKQAYSHFLKINRFYF